MKVLFAACRYDPMDPDAGSGVDYCVYQQFKSLGVEMKVVGPFKDEPSAFEKVYRFGHRYLSRKMHAKFSDAYLRRTAEEVDKAVQEFQPDVIWTKDLIPLVYLKAKCPIIFRTDALFYGTITQWPTYSRLESLRMLTWEKRALEKATILINASDWAKDLAVSHYGFKRDHVIVIPAIASLPTDIFPKKIHKKISKNDLHLLFVGKEFTRKRPDIAIGTLKRLREKGIDAHLRIVGNTGVNEPGVEYMGLYRKKEPGQLEAYVSNYDWANFLIHPAVYEAGGIACSEAAGFGVPTITNAAGGLETTVKDGISGVVLPRASAADEYANVILDYLARPEDYETLCSTTRERFDKDLNWDAAFLLIKNAINEFVIK
jgi:glycosyltransferase involved in cell wall biosynthesis